LTASIRRQGLSSTRGFIRHRRQAKSGANYHMPGGQGTIILDV
jgi:hypothetical protein